MPTVMKVSTKTNPNSLAGAIAEILKEVSSVELHCVGAGSINQAFKSIAIARGFVAPRGIDLICIPVLHIIQIDGEDRTGGKFIVEPRYKTN